MSTGAAPKEPLPLTPEQQQTVAQVASTAQLLAGILLLFGPIQIAVGVVAGVKGTGLFGAVLMVVLGAVTALLGLVMLAVSSDFRYLGEHAKYRANHLRNAAKNLTMFHQALLGFALLLALVMLVRTAM